MTSQTFRGSSPAWRGSFDQPLPSFMFVQDMLIKLPGAEDPVLPYPLECLESMYWAAFQRYPWESHKERYCYVSAKRQPLGAQASFSRPGWHIDGYLSTDDTFIYSDVFPTLYSVSTFTLSPEHGASLVEMQAQARPEDTREMSAGALVHISRTCVHRVQIPPVPHTRTFVKFVFSHRPFNLEGNAINPLLPAPWPMMPRRVEVNQDSTLTRNGDSRRDPSS